MMYAHAYQSFIWNSLVSERIKLFGFEEPVVGDLVAVDEISGPSETDTPQPEEMDLDEVAEIADVEEELEPEKVKVAIVNEEDVRAKKYSIEQVVIPLPGHSVVYPTHSVTQKMREMMTKDGLDPDNLKRAQKEYDLKCAYRKMIVKPSDFSWKIMRYDDVTIPLMPNDLDTLQKRPEPADIPTGKYKALLLSFNLPSSCYATMLFRELLKVPTDKFAQKNLSEEFASRDTTTEEKEGKGEEENKERGRGGERGGRGGGRGGERGGRGGGRGGERGGRGRGGNDGNFNRNRYEKRKREGE